jgi:hypothetical protein
MREGFITLLFICTGNDTCEIYFYVSRSSEAFRVCPTEGRDAKMTGYGRGLLWPHRLALAEPDGAKRTSGEGASAAPASKHPKSRSSSAVRLIVEPRRRLTATSQENFLKEVSDLIGKRQNNFMWRRKFKDLLGIRKFLPMFKSYVIMSYILIMAKPFYNPIF